MCHVASSYWYTKHNDIDAAWIIGNLMDTYSRWAVIGFYLLSGYFTLKIPEQFLYAPVSTVWIFYRSRLCRIFIPALTMVVAYMLYWGPYDPQVTLSFPRDFFDIHTLLRTPAYPLWYLYPLFGFILVTPALWVLSLTTIGKFFIEVALFLWISVAILATMPFAYFGNMDFMKHSVFAAIFRAVNEHMYLKHIGWGLIGGCWMEHCMKKAENPVVFRKIVAVFICSLIIIAISPYVAAYLRVDEWAEAYRDYVRPPVALFGITSFVVIPRWLRQNPRLQASLARFTPLCFPVYLFHAGIIEILRPWSFAARPFNFPPLMDICLRTLIIIAISVFCGYIYISLQTRMKRV